MSGALTTTEATRLAECETRIERGLTTFIEVGQALMEIRDQRLYRTSHARFEDYCTERWGFTRRQGNRLIEAAAVTEGLGPIGPTPANESVARELPREPEQAREVWAEAVERHGDTPTAAEVREVRAGREAEPDEPDEVIDPPEPPDDDLDTKRREKLAREHERQQIADAAVRGFADAIHYVRTHKISPSELVKRTTRLNELSRCSPETLAYLRSVEGELSNSARPAKSGKTPAERSPHTEVNA